MGETIKTNCPVCGSVLHFADAPPPPQSECVRCGGTGTVEAEPLGTIPPDLSKFLQIMRTGAFGLAEVCDTPVVMVGKPNVGQLTAIGSMAGDDTLAGLAEDAYRRRGTE